MTQFKFFTSLVVLAVFLSVTAFAKSKNGLSTKGTPSNGKSVAVVKHATPVSEVQDQPGYNKSNIRQDDINFSQMEVAERHREALRFQKENSGTVIYSTSPRGSIVQSLTGDYHVGVGKTFANLHDLAVALNFATVTGATRFLLDDASYTETSGLSIGLTDGASATNTITIQPNTGNTAVTITVTNNASAGGGLVFTGSKYVTVNGTADGGTPGARNLTIQYDGSQSLPAGSDDATIRIRDGAQNVSVTNCNLTSQTTSSNSRAAVSITHTSLNTSNITVNNCDITGDRKSTRLNSSH